MESPKRRELLAGTSAALEAIRNPRPALVGFDGFVDSIVHLVDLRTDMSPGGYKRLRTIPEFAARCAHAAGRSTNIEQVLIEKRFGGNGPLMAGALARLGAPTTFIGAVEDPATHGQIHPLFRDFASRCERVVPLCEPSWTDCLEFDDGKIMLNNTASVQQVTWELVVERLGLDHVRAIVARSELLGIVNWSLLGGVPGIWRGLMRDVLPGLPGSRRVFIDLSDPAKRTDKDILNALSILRDLEEFPALSVTLGLNLAEAQRIGSVVGVSISNHATAGQALAEFAARVRDAIRIDTLVIHPREGACAAHADGAREWLDGPLTLHPRLSTGAGDHFNAGFALAQSHSMPLSHCLAAGVGASGAYVRDGESPTLSRLASFVRDLPPPEMP